MTVYLSQPRQGEGRYYGIGGSNLGVEGVRSRWGQPTVTWWYILVVAESNGLNLSLGLTLTQRSPPHTHGATANAERPAARRTRWGCQLETSKVGFEVSLRAQRKERHLHACFYSGKQAKSESLSSKCREKRLLFGGVWSAPRWRRSTGAEKKRGEVGDVSTATVKRLHFCWTN